MSYGAESARPVEGVLRRRAPKPRNCSVRAAASRCRRRPTKDLSLAAQWFFNWQAIACPESGTYLTVNDALNFGGDSSIFGRIRSPRAIPGAPAYLRAVERSRRSAVALQQPRRLGHLGALEPGVARRHAGLLLPHATDMLPQVDRDAGRRRRCPPAPCAAIGGTPLRAGAPASSIRTRRQRRRPHAEAARSATYERAYGDDIHIYGLSLSKNIGGVSVGAELSYRQNMPLLSDPVQVLPAPLRAACPGLDRHDRVARATGTPGARGDTWHGVLNGCRPCPKTPLFDTAALPAELTWMHWAR